LEVVYVGALETEESCQRWQEEFSLPFPVFCDEDGALFRRLTNGWVPCNILVDKNGEVLFAEDDFDEEGFSNAIAGLYKQAEGAQLELAPMKQMRREGLSEGANIVILGGGAGGVVAAHHLRKRLPQQHRVVVIDRSPDHVFSSSFLWRMVGQRQDDQICRPLESLARKGIEFHQGEVEQIDLRSRLVWTPSGDFDFDYLIVSLGAQLVPESVPGFDDMAYDLYDLEGCGRIHTALESFTGGTIGVLIPFIPLKCPAAPYEAAFLAEAFCRRKGIREATQIHLFTAEHQPMPQAGPEMGEALAEMLRARGIHYHPLFTFKELRPETKEVVSSDGRSHQIDLLIAVPPHQAPDVIRTAGLLGVSGWVHVDPRTLRTEHDGVYAIGDVTNIKLADGKALPKAGVFAHYQAKVVAEQIVSDIRGKQSMALFDGKGSCWIMLGDGKAAFAGGRFYAEPSPQVRIYRPGPGRLWHWAKVLFEKWWLSHWF
jgi:sulfide:quinone oxidoreductase